MRVFIILIMLVLLFVYCLREHAPLIEQDIVTRVTKQLQEQGFAWTKVEFDGRDIKLAGTTQSLEALKQVESMAAAVWGVRSIENQIIVIEPKRLEYNTTFILRNGIVTVAGMVPDALTHDSLIEKMHVQFGSKNVKDELVVQAGIGKVWYSIVYEILNNLSLFEYASISLIDRQLSVSGLVDSHKVSKKVIASLTEVLPESHEIILDINVNSALQHSTLKTHAGISCQRRFNQLLNNSYIQFATASADIAVDSHTLLDKLVEVAQSCPEAIIHIVGHTDAQGQPEMNIQLSKLRAGSVAHYLITKGINADSLVIEGYGDKVPIGDNNTAEGRRMNRRIEFSVREQ